ncbi:hypothetical protein GMOD_00002522 [Pyrenophora seminiperda CCB06]|uniref:Uncharacterized protein n=1 Tax=Pyrenophora seminiperda CCB06 TaxID=1302712 RepID=A0A3M7M2L5_9PLEO|nr:hypothetical protein GMOD_00002522 [Pyrenophora seminiperda CCB06]
MSSQSGGKAFAPIELQQTPDVPADHSDPNHPHFPTDPETHLPPRSFYTPSSCISWKFLWIISGSLLTIGSIIGAGFLGIKFGTDKARAEYQKFDIATTFITTTVIPTVSTVYVTPTSATATVTFSSTTTTVTRTLGTIDTYMFPTTEPSKSTCTSHGSWPTIEECNENCAVLGNRTACGVWTGGFTCVACPLAEAKAN